jgi:6-pyruvoyltetrahydropterin/6-carboxytetrahydropterin synthase
MFEVRVESVFSSAHRLRQYKGKCEKLHGHNWKVEVFVESKKLDKNGMVADFKKVKKLLEQVLKELDHTFLNDIGYFKKVNPTSENIAKYIFYKIRVKDKKLNIKKVTVWESDISAASFVRL